MTGVATWFDSTRGHSILFRGGFDMSDFKVTVQRDDASRCVTPQRYAPMWECGSLCFSGDTKTTREASVASLRARIEEDYAAQIEALKAALI